ncbi:MAG: lycopene cyclase family protein [Limnohabitans sp.]|nr:lycopene cyclase family protein [Limnohabitans sp.]
MKYDFIFCGAGLAGLMLLKKMASNGILEGKTILILDPKNKDTQDRTWCYWEKGSGKWDEIVKYKWEKAVFQNNVLSVECLEKQYSYKMIESVDFYKLCLNELRGYNVVWKKESVVSVDEDLDFVKVTTNENFYYGRLVFNSILNYNQIKANKKFPLLRQHFVGWFVKTKENNFNSEQATFMDFSVEQKGNTRFMYVLPISRNEALIEYTLFSPGLLEKNEYEEEIAKYLKNQGIFDFEIVRKEEGDIPMTVFPFWENNSKRVLNIGSAGGWTKASTGYTFYNCDKLTDRLLCEFKKKEIDFSQFNLKTRFTFYDAIFIKVLYHNNYLGESVFFSMFGKVSPSKILKFLNEETSVFEELRVLMSCPKLPFIKALFKK